MMPGLLIVAHMCLAMVLGWVVGYERFFSGRAAGSQVYCIVSATAAAVTLLAGYGDLGTQPDAGDATRVIGSILTGIGFLGAGLIVQSGMSVRGLTTAASIWGVAALGILVGARMYLPAIGLTALFVIAVELVPWLERRLPTRTAFSSTLKFCEGYEPHIDAVLAYLSERGLSMPAESVTLKYRFQRFEIQCLIFADARRSASMCEVALELAAMPAVESFVMTRSSRA